MAARRCLALFAVVLAFSAVSTAAECEAESAASAQCSRSLASVQSAASASAAQAAQCQSALAAAQAESASAVAALAALQGSWLPPALGSLPSILGAHAGGLASSVQLRLQALAAALPSIEVPHVAALEGLRAQLGEVVGPLGAHASLSEDQSVTLAVAFFFTLLALLLSLALAKPKTTKKAEKKAPKAASPAAAKAPAASKAAPKAAKSPVVAETVVSPGRPKRATRA